MYTRLARPRFAAIVLLLSLAASLLVAAFRFSIERHSRHVEIAMDYNDLVQQARSYDQDPSQLLIALRRAGLTSVALYEELGVDVNDSGKATLLTGSQLLAASRLSTVNDPALAALVRGGQVNSGMVFLTVNDPMTYARYRSTLPLHFEAKSIKIVRATRPWIIEVRTQSDYFNAVSLGIPDDQVAMARHLGLEIIPRFQNDENYGPNRIAAMFDSLHGYKRVSTFVFYGLRNQVLGYADHLQDTANAMTAHNLTFGAIEVYDDSQLQKGTDTLARAIRAQTVRVQAIAKSELDKLKFDEVVGRYVLGVRERNIRVVYLRPYLHHNPGMTVQATNVELVKAIADQLKANGYTLMRASPVPLYRGNGYVLVGIAMLAIPSLVVLLLGALGWYRLWHAIVAYGVTILLYLAGVLLGHDMLVRSVFALLGALGFAALAFALYERAFADRPVANTREQLVRSLVWTLIATAAALLGALVVVGLMSSPLAMEEIEKMRGVKLVLAVPPLVALLMYIFGPYSGDERPGGSLLTPVKAYQLIVGAIAIGAGALLLMRSGNQSDIAPSGIELSLRHGLSAILSVRPRTKEFLIGFPAMMLVPALLPAHRRTIGWLLALAVGVGIGDVIDTFSHLHTALTVSILRVVLGLVIGVVVGGIAIVIYRAIVVRLSPAQ